MTKNPFCYPEHLSFKSKLPWMAEWHKNNNPGGNIQSIFSKDINTLLFFPVAIPHVEA